MESIKESKWIYVLLSVLIATTIWLFVREEKEIEKRVRGVPVTVTGERVLENQGLLIDIPQESVNLTWKGSWRDIAPLDKNSVSVSVDVSQISGPGTYELGYNISYPPTVATSAISLQNSDPSQITVVVSEIYSETFAVQPALVGSVAEGYQAGEFILEPENILISGLQQKVNQIDRVQVVLEQKNLKETFSGELTFRLLDANGKELEKDGLRFSTETVYTVLPIVVVKEIPLTVDFIDGGGATAKNIKYEIAPKTITVSGAQKDILHLDKLSLGSIDLAQVLGTTTESFPIYLPAELENVSGISNAEVTVTISDLSTKAFEVSDINLINEPKGYTATLTTRVRTIVLRGTQQELDKVSAGQIRIVADLSELSTATGSYNVPVKVYLYTDGNVGVIGQNNVVVNLSKK